VVVADPSPKKKILLSFWVDKDRLWWGIPLRKKRKYTLRSGPQESLVVVDPLQTKKKIHLFNMVDKDR
jgi:hypothetical protein